jgi:hypothetical protein
MMSGMVDIEISNFSFRIRLMLFGLESFCRRVEQKFHTCQQHKSPCANESVIASQDRESEEDY